MSARKQPTPEPSQALVKAVQHFDVKSWADVQQLKTRPDYDTAAATLVAVKALLKQAEEEKNSICRPINAGLKIIRDKYNRVVEPLETAAHHIGLLLTGFEREERQKQIREAEKAAKLQEKKGNAQYAEDIRQQALTTPAVKAEGLSTRTTKKADIFDSAAFFAAVLRGEVPSEIVSRMLTEALIPLNALARTGAPLPAGVRCIEVESKVLS